MSKASSAQADKNQDGFYVHEVESPFQKGKTQIYVLLPDKMEKDKKYPVCLPLTGQVSVKGSHRVRCAMTTCQAMVVTHGTAFSGSGTGLS